MEGGIKVIKQAVPVYGFKMDASFLLGTILT
jgi:hypothetical protein